MQGFDVLVIGAGAAGLHCAAIAGQRGLSVAVADHADRIAEKVRISGGGRCNFTNLDSSADCFISANPDFCRSALSGFGPKDFIRLLRSHGVPFHEKHRGQLFADESSESVIRVLLAECARGGVKILNPCRVQSIRKSGDGFEVDTSVGGLACARLVIATGGLSIPKIGASDFGYRIARQFGHRIVEPRPGLVPLVFDAEAWQAWAALAGLSLPVAASLADSRRPRPFADDLLFTHKGLSGPAALQISSYWQPGARLRIEFLGPDSGWQDWLAGAKSGSRRRLDNELASRLPRRLAEAWLEAEKFPGSRAIAEIRDAELARLAQSLSAWSPQPAGTEGFRKAEVTVGGVDTRDLNSKDMQSRLMPGVHFIGEVVDVTGWLGGHNFQWAWSSAAACANSIEKGQIRVAGTPI